MSVKNAVPNSRSNDIKASATVKTGKAKIMIKLVINEDQVNIGIFINVIPFVRILKIVTKS